jgi:hypothetical protein
MLLDLSVDGLPADAEHPCRLGLVPVGLLRSFMIFLGSSTTLVSGALLSNFSNRPTEKYDNILELPALINQGKPPALPERLPEFDNSGNIRKPPTVNCSKFKKEGGFR